MRTARQRRLLGMDLPITRRDFLNAALLGAGAALLDLPAPLALCAGTPDWDGFGGVGDYAASHGNVESVVRAGHGLRDGLYDAAPPDAAATGEVFDLVVVGGGLSGLGAAFQFSRAAGETQRCLVLDNQPVVGGEAKRNEFIVDGHRLIAPQGSNSFVVLDEPGGAGAEIYSALGVPRRFSYRQAAEEVKALRFDQTNYGFMLWHDAALSVGYFFDAPSGGAAQRWTVDLWRRGLDSAPFSPKARQDLRAWRQGPLLPAGERPVGPRLDALTYKEYLEKVLGLDPAVTKFVDPILAVSMGLGSDVVSAYGAYLIGMPGFEAAGTELRRSDREWHSFPGGNDGFVRFLLKRLIPASLRGKDGFDDILNQPIDVTALDTPGGRVRIRTGATVVRVEHEGAGQVRVTYVKDGKAYILKARGVVMASGSWTSRRAVRDLPEELRAAYGAFHRSPVMVANVALGNWRFLARLGITACRWFEGFGFSCNIRRPMLVGDYRPPLHPDSPAVLTFYVPFFYPGAPLRAQGARGRTELLSTSYAEYEAQIREQMVRLFGSAGFDPRRDIRGIILNRWGHAYVNPQPGFFFGGDGRPAPREVLRRGFGRVAFANADLNGHQHWVAAVGEGMRAARGLGYS